MKQNRVSHRVFYWALLSGALALSSAAQAETTYDIAVFSALDKITAEISKLEAPLGEKVTFGTLEVLVHSCNKRPPEEPPQTTAFVEVFEKGLVVPGDDKSADGGDAALEGPNIGSVVSTISDFAKNDVAPNEYAKGELPPPPVPGGDMAEEGEGEKGGRPAGVRDPEHPDRIFSGWMFASSPGLNAVEHPVYDVWLTDCKMSSGGASSGSE
jgi:hypothetical protein